MTWFERVDIFRARRSVANILLLIFLCYYANITLFSHNHVVDGVTIVHSHFYNKNHANTTGDSAHSEGELELVNAISKFVAETQESFTPIVVVAEPTYLHYAEVALSTLSPSECTLALLRAPPAMTIFG